MWYRKYYKLAVWILCIAAPIFGFCTQRKTKYRSVCELTPNFVQSHNFLTTFWQLFYRKMSQNEPSEKHKKNPWKRHFISIFKDFCVGGDMGIRTPDLLHAKQPLSQLSYTPTLKNSRNHSVSAGCLTRIWTQTKWVRVTCANHYTIRQNKWCEQWDLNPHAISTRPSNVPVCRFQHARIC